MLEIHSFYPEAEMVNSLVISESKHKAAWDGRSRVLVRKVTSARPEENDQICAYFRFFAGASAIAEVRNSATEGTPRPSRGQQLKSLLGMERWGQGSLAQGGGLADRRKLRYHPVPLCLNEPA